MFYVSGHWMWTGDRYVWRAGYWTRARTGYVYVPSHYRWTPYGHVFVAGYWDYSVSRRGVLYAPITVDVVVAGPRYVYTPYYAVRDTIVLDTLFVRPAYGAYYFGDYYGPRYVEIGFEPCVVYSRRHYEPIIVYERWHHRHNPRWHDTQITLVVERNAGRAPVPPRTLVQQTTIIQNTTNVTNVTNVIAPTKTVVLGQGNKTVPLDMTTRTQVAKTTQSSQQAMAAERRKLESSPASSTPLTKPRTTPLAVTPTVPVASKMPPLGSNPTPTKDLGKGVIPVDSKGKDLGKGLPPLDPKGTKDPGKTFPPPKDPGKLPPSLEPKTKAPPPRIDPKKVDDKKRKG
jgi:hypothetical protein